MMTKGIAPTAENANQLKLQINIAWILLTDSAGKSLQRKASKKEMAIVIENPQNGFQLFACSWIDREKIRGKISIIPKTKNKAPKK